MSLKRSPLKRAATGLGAPKQAECDFAWLQELLKDAESTSRLTDFEEEFLNGQRDRVLQYGEKVRISEAQMKILQQIEQKVHA